MRIFMVMMVVGMSVVLFMIMLVFMMVMMFFFMIMDMMIIFNTMMVIVCFFVKITVIVCMVILRVVIMAIHNIMQMTMVMVHHVNCTMIMSVLMSMPMVTMSMIMPMCTTTTRMFQQGHTIHEPNPHQKRENLRHSPPLPRAFLQQTGQNRDCRQIHKTPCCKGNHEVRANPHPFLHGVHPKETDECSAVCRDGSGELCEDGFGFCHARADEYGIISEFMRYFVEEDG